MALCHLAIVIIVSIAMIAVVFLAADGYELLAGCFSIYIWIIAIKKNTELKILVESSEL